MIVTSVLLTNVSNIENHICLSIISPVRSTVNVNVMHTLLFRNFLASGLSKAGRQC